MLKESIKMSWQNIVNNKMRSFLTILGIVIGVAAIIALITIVQGVSGEVTSQFSALGANTLSVSAKGTPLKTGLSENDLQKIASLDDVSGISPTVSARLPLEYNGELKENVTIQGKNEVYFKKEAGNLKYGRGLNVLDIDNKNRVCVISESIEQDLFTAQNAVDKQLLIGGITYTVVGVKKNDTSMMSMLSSKDAVYVPYRNAMSLSGTNTIASLDVYMSRSEKADDIVESVKTVLNQAFNYKDDSYTVTNMEDLLGVMNDITGMMSTMLAGIASIALLVGGIGIMNMMLVSVTERTTEIGLRKALGAEPKRIQMQFLLESIFLSLFGGVAGLLLGVLIALLVAIGIGYTFTVSIGAIVLAVGFSASVGIIFGLAPARKASRLNPIDALRSI